MSVLVDSSFRITRRGTIRTSVNERYLRDDISCGIQNCQQCDVLINKLSQEHPIIVPDATSISTQMAFFESSHASNILLLDSVVNTLSATVYKRIRNLVTTSPQSFHVFANLNHRPSAIPADSSPSEVIQSTLHWFSIHTNAQIVLLTEDESLTSTISKLNLHNLSSMSTHSFVSTFMPSAIDIVLPSRDACVSFSSRFNGYPPHVEESAALSAVSKGKAFVGTFRASRFNPFKGTVTGSKLETPINLIDRNGVNRAMDGDRVVVIMDEDKGQVVSILNRNLRDFCGSIEPPSESAMVGNVYFYPVAENLPRFKLKLPKNPKDYVGKRLVVRVDDWSDFDLFPTAHVVRVIGDIGNRLVESEVILIEHQVPYNEFGKAVLDCLPPSNYVISQSERSKRFDFTRLPICSIDPPGCKDIDDALHARYVVKEGRTLVEVGVHIADVTHFVTPNTAIDTEAWRRSTTTYLVDRRVDMLPRLLTEDLCSLRCNVERFAFSCIWVMDPTDNFKIVETSFGKSIIKSQAAFTYSEAQIRKDDVSLKDELTESIRLLNKVALSLRESRVLNGALVLASTAVKFSMDEITREPVDVSEYETVETNYLVEEFMLLANHSVAHQIYTSFPSTALLRRHPSPLPSAFDSLIASLKPLGITLNFESNLELAKSLEGVPKRYEKYVKQQVTRCMALAQYFSCGEYERSQYFHYGLSLDLYTHFTSPIRRYADCVVHRLLAASLGVAPLPFELSHKDRVSEICQVLNHRHKNAQDAGRMSMVVTSLLLLDQPTKQHGIVTKVLEKGVVVFVPKYGVEALVRLDARSDFVLKEELSEVHVGGRKLTLFDRVDVILKVDEHARTHALKPSITLIFLEGIQSAQKIDLNEEE
ncbi:hypothetical protein P9112_011180 [Eukaryota sp. TZLM1-RC]